MTSPDASAAGGVYRPLSDAPRHRVILALDPNGEEIEAIHTGRAWFPYPIEGQDELIPQPTMGRW